MLDAMFNCQCLFIFTFLFALRPRTNHIGANFAVALRQIYNRYLLQYEKTSSGNFTTTNEQWNEDEDEEKYRIPSLSVLSTLIDVFPFLQFILQYQSTFEFSAPVVKSVTRFEQCYRFIGTGSQRYQALLLTSKWSS